MIASPTDIPQVIVEELQARIHYLSVIQITGVGLEPMATALSALFTTTYGLAHS